MGLLLHPVYVFWCISAYFNGYIDLKRDNGVTPPVSGLKSGYWYDYHISNIQKYSLGYFFVQLLHAITEYNYFQPAAGVPAERSECKPRINVWAKQKNPRYMVIVPWAHFFTILMGRIQKPAIVRYMAYYHSQNRNCYFDLC